MKSKEKKMNSFEKKSFILTRLFIYIFFILGWFLENLDYKFIFCTLCTLLVIYDICETGYKLKKK